MRYHIPWQMIYMDMYILSYPMQTTYPVYQMGTKGKRCMTCYWDFTSMHKSTSTFVGEFFFFFFFFLISKLTYKRYIYMKREKGAWRLTQSIQGVYKRSQKARAKRRVSDFLSQQTGKALHNKLHCMFKFIENVW